MRSDYVKKGHKNKIPSYPRNRKARNLDTDIRQEDNKSLGLIGGSNLADDTAITKEQ